MGTADSCPITKLDDGLLSLHEADDDAINWLKMTATKALAQWNEMNAEIVAGVFLSATGVHADSIPVPAA